MKNIRILSENSVLGVEIFNIFEKACLHYERDFLEANI